MISTSKNYDTEVLFNTQQYTQQCTQQFLFLFYRQCCPQRESYSVQDAAGLCGDGSECCRRGRCFQTSQN